MKKLILILSLLLALSSCGTKQQEVVVNNEVTNTWVLESTWTIVETWVTNTWITNSWSIEVNTWVVTSTWSEVMTWSDNNLFSSDWYDFICNDKWSPSENYCELYIWWKKIKKYTSCWDWCYKPELITKKYLKIFDWVWPEWSSEIIFDLKNIKELFSYNVHPTWLSFSKWDFFINWYNSKNWESLWLDYNKKKITVNTVSYKNINLTYNNWITCDWLYWPLNEKWGEAIDFCIFDKIDDSTIEDWYINLSSWNLKVKYYYESDTITK